MRQAVVACFILLSDVHCSHTHVWKMDQEGLVDEQSHLLAAAIGALTQSSLTQLRCGGNRSPADDIVASAAHAQ